VNGTVEKGSCSYGENRKEGPPVGWSREKKHQLREPRERIQLPGLGEPVRKETGVPFCANGGKRGCFWLVALIPCSRRGKNLDHKTYGFRGKVGARFSKTSIRTSLGRGKGP